MPYAEYSVHIDAPPDKVWQAMVDVERWPSFAAQFRRIERKEHGPLALGSGAKVSLRGFTASVWIVTEYVEGRSFTWEADALPGLHFVAGHVVEAEGTGTRATLRLRSSGLLGALFAPAEYVIFRRNTRLEGEGMKAYCERGSQ